MSVECEELADSRERTEGTNPTALLRYSVKYFHEDSEALAVVIAESPTEFEALGRQEVKLKPDGPDMWLAEVSYGLSSKEAGTWDMTFDGSGGSQKITQSLDTRWRQGINGQQAPDFGGAIGVTDSGVEGCEIPIPKFSFTISYRFAAPFVNKSYGVVCSSLVGKINSGVFWGYAPGTLVYMGPTGKFSGSLAAGARESVVEIGHRFDFSPHMLITVGGTQLQKYGWDYFWVRYLQKKDQATNSRILVPQAAYCERVLEEANFGSLGIGS
jgi:hypothetical protein